MSVSQEAASAPSPSGRATFLLKSHFDAGAVVTWLEEGVSVEIRLYRFKGLDVTTSSNDAYAFYDSECNYASYGSTSTDMQSHVVTSIPNGHSVLYTYPKKDKDGYEYSHGIAVRGDVVAEVWIYQHGTISVERSQSTLVQQWSRL